MGTLQRFKTDQRGTTAILFGLAILPVLGLAGAAVDYSRAALAHSRMQSATDLAALSIVKLPLGASQATIDKLARDTVESVTGVQAGVRSAAGVTYGTPMVTRTGKQVQVRATATSDSSLMQAVGFPSTAIATNSQAIWSAKKIELALVLDNTGSMGDSIGGGRRKIDALKDSARQLLSDLRDAAKEQDTVKVSIVPFDTEVRLDAAAYRSKPWFDWARSKTDPAKWTGYVFDRYNGFALSDAAPSVGILDSLFPAPQVSEFAAYGSLQTIRPLTSLYDLASYNALNAVVSGMTPRGNTNVALGANWGLATLTSSEPFNEGAPATDKDVKKYMVILTDGENTMNHVNGLQVGNVGGQIDAKTRAACQTAKDANVEIFTIRLVKGDEGLLRSCASGAGNYFDAQDANQLGNAFRTIVDAISGTRISS